VEPLRQPAVAGRFYPADRARLEAQVMSLLGAPTAAFTERAAVAVVVPHAGYVYSGAIAGSAFARVRVPRTAIVLGPNHTGLGAARALWRAGAWQLPNAVVPIDVSFADALLATGECEADEAAHLGEHSLEVELPFLLARQPALSLVPLCVSRLPYEECERLGRALAETIASRGGPEHHLLVASTDFSHYVSAGEAARKDGLALDRLLALDAVGLYEVVFRERISMCGVIPTVITLIAARELGADTAELVRQGHSGSVSGDLERVVGYASCILGQSPHAPP
jgi:AmmeMemoRadiSam system protein B